MSCATGMALWLSTVATATAHTSASDSPAVTTFTSWCADVGIGLNHVEWHDEASATALTNRQTVATAPISKGDPVISIPLSAVLNVEHALSDPVVGAIWDTKEGAELSELDILAAFLVYELYKPSDSRWQQYLDFLPRTYPSNPLYYTEEELVQLKGLCVEPFVLRRRHQVNTSFTLVERVVTAGDPNGRHFKPGMLTADRFRCAVYPQAGASSVLCLSYFCSSSTGAPHGMLTHMVVCVHLVHCTCVQVGKRDGEKSLPFDITQGWRRQVAKGHVSRSSCRHAQHGRRHCRCQPRMQDGHCGGAVPLTATVSVHRHSGYPGRNRADDRLRWQFHAPRRRSSSPRVCFLVLLFAPAHSMRTLLV
jgi:hypothetical protein